MKHNSNNNFRLFTNPILFHLEPFLKLMSKRMVHCAPDIWVSCSVWGHICNWQCLWLHLGLIHQSCHLLKVLEIVAKLECLLRCPFTLPYGYCTSINTDDKGNVIWDEWMDAKMLKVLLFQAKGQMCSSGRWKLLILYLR